MVCTHVQACLCTHVCTAGVHSTPGYIVLVCEHSRCVCMFKHLCVHVCTTGVHMCACVSTHHMYMCSHMHVYTRVHSWCVWYTVCTLCLCVSTHGVYACSSTCVYVCARLCAYVQVCVSTRHMYVCSSMHVYTCARLMCTVHCVYIVLMCEHVHVNMRV